MPGRVRRGRVPLQLPRGGRRDVEPGGAPGADEPDGAGDVRDEQQHRGPPGGRPGARECARPRRGRGNGARGGGHAGAGGHAARARPDGERGSRRGGRHARVCADVREPRHDDAARRRARGDAAGGAYGRGDGRRRAGGRHGHLGAPRTRGPEGIGCRAVSDGGAFPFNCPAAVDVTWSLGVLPAQTSRTVQVTFVTSSSTAVLPEGALVLGSARVRDAARGTARAEVDTPVQEGTPLVLGLTESADPVAAGDTLEYALTFGNRGTTTQLGAELAATLPAGLTAVATDGGVLAGGTGTLALRGPGGRRGSDAGPCPTGARSPSTVPRRST